MRPAVITVAITGCTSFAFKNTGKGSAPDELTDGLCAEHRAPALEVPMSDRTAELEGRFAELSDAMQLTERDTYDAIALTASSARPKSSAAIGPCQLLAPVCASRPHCRAVMSL